MNTTTPTSTTVKVPAKTFRDLGTWQAARDLAVAVQRHCEAFSQPGQALAYQLSRATINVCGNIAKGFTQWEAADKDESFAAGLAALIEVENLLIVAHDTGYITLPQHDDLMRRRSDVHWMLTKLRKLNQEWAKQREMTKRA